MEVINERLIRYVAPTKFDFAPYGTRWVLLARAEDPAGRLFVQTNSDEKKPRWVEIEDILKAALNSLLDDDEFIDYCVEEYCVRTQIN
jgi:hypothetical protein